MTATEAIVKNKDMNIGPFYFDPLTIMSLIANVQLATRHPLNNGDSRRIAEQTARELQRVLSEKIPEVSAILEMGWNPDLDY